MRLTPIDIRRQEFARRVRGVDPDEVKTFLDLVAGQWQELTDELRRAEERVREAEQKLVHYQRIEQALEQALETARGSARQTVEAAEQKARAVLDHAEQQAVAIKRDAEEERIAIRRQTHQLVGRRDEALAHLRSFLMSEIEMLARFDQQSGLFERHREERAQGLIGEGTAAPTVPAPPEKPAAAPNLAPPKRPPATGSATAGDGTPFRTSLHQSDTPSGPEDERAPERRDDRDGPGWIVHPVFSAASSKAATQAEPPSGEPETYDDVEASANELARIRQTLQNLD